MMTAVTGKRDVNIVLGKRGVIILNIVLEYVALSWCDMYPLRDDCNSVWVELGAGI